MDNIFYKIVEIKDLDKKRSYFNKNIEIIKKICKYIEENKINLDTPPLKKAGGFIIVRILKENEEINNNDKADLINCLYKAGADLNYTYRAKIKRDEHACMTIPEMIKYKNNPNIYNKLDNEIKKLVDEARDFAHS